MKILFVNLVYGTGSTGNIVQNLVNGFADSGNECAVIYGFLGKTDFSPSFKTVCSESVNAQRFELIRTRLTGINGFFKHRNTKQMLQFIENFNPDIINIHNMHGNWIDCYSLISFIKEKKYKLVLTLHDCWTFTGHCPHFQIYNCDKYLTSCNKCSHIRECEYPRSWFFDKSFKQFELKKKMFSGSNAFLVGPCNWIINSAIQSRIFLHHSCACIHNGIDFFKIACNVSKYENTKFCALSDQKILLGVSSKWTHSKGIDEFLKLNQVIDHRLFKIVLVGKCDKKIRKMYKDICFIDKTSSNEELARLYKSAFVFLNPTLADTFPTTNLESLQCGTPVITYNTGGCSDICNNVNSILVEKNTVEGLLVAISKLEKNYPSFNSTVNFGKTFSIKKMVSGYLDLFQKL